ncbi:MAG: hypothetical protein C3F11_01055 [Methylocystaceae bacterium]|nr:MAG: hypothetical protein C3F11_01055 [Methylocystaceae bacterium]
MPLIEAFLDEGEDLELLWLAGLEKDATRGWLVRPVTQGLESKQIKPWLPPIGLLPLLAPGRCFSAGDPSRTVIRGEITNFTIENVGDGEEVTSDFVPPEIFPAAGRKTGVQRLLRYWADGLDILVPTFELVRYLFVHNKTMANALMRPGGVMELFRAERPGLYERLTLRFTRKMPVSLLTPTFVAEFAWVAIHPDGRRSWDSVSALSLGQRYLSFHPPPLVNSEWLTRSVWWRNTVLVLEILSATGKRHACDVLRYSHPSIRETLWTKGTTRGAGAPPSQASSTREIRDYVIDQRAAGSRIDTRQSALEAPAKTSTFDRRIEITKVVDRAFPGADQNTDQTDETRIARGAYRSDAIVRRRVRVHVSVAEEALDATLPPIEFKLLEPAEPDYLGELAALIGVIGLMAKMLPTVSIAMSLCSLKQGRAFSLAGRRRRVCLIAVIRPPARPPLAIIDVDHSGGCALSSIVLEYHRPCSFQEMEEHVAALLGSLVDRGGRWDTELAVEFGDACECRRLPRVLRLHERQNDKHYRMIWAMRLTEELGLEKLRG